jgi:hypothetical protein
MAGSGTDSLVSDGCTGFGWAEHFFPIRTCCEIHDNGGTDGQLLDCLMNATPEWSWALVGFCVALMILLRPIYRLIKPKGNARH